MPMLTLSPPSAVIQIRPKVKLDILPLAYLEMLLYEDPITAGRTDVAADVLTNTYIEKDGWNLLQIWQLKGQSDGEFQLVVEQARQLALTADLLLGDTAVPT
jgi:hypothetical protein